MAAVYRKKYPIPIPDSAEIITRRGQKLARWKSGKGQVRMAEVLDKNRVRFVSDCWYIRYRDASGVMRRQSTACRDKQAAEKVLADVLADVEKVKAGIMSHQEMSAAGQRETPITSHVQDYLAHLAARTVRGGRISPKHVNHVRAQLGRIVKECRFHLLKDINRQSVQQWINRLAQTARNHNTLDPASLSPRTINIYRSAIVAFCNWCVGEGRLPSNPIRGLPKAEDTQPARRRRLLTEEELPRLLRAAQKRPLQDALTISRGKNKGQALAQASPKERIRLKS